MKALGSKTAVGLWWRQDRQIFNAVHGVEAARGGVRNRPHGRG